MKSPNTMTASEINKERDRIARVLQPKLETKYRNAGRDPDVATCYLRASDPLDAEMLAQRGRWYALQNEILKECGPGVMKFPLRYRRKFRVV